MNIKSYKIVFALSCIAIVMMCCKTAKPAAGTASKNLLEPNECDFAIADAHWPSTTLNDLNEGYSLFNDKCTRCHGIKKPQDFSANEWSILMRKMGRKANLDSNQYHEVYHYILTKREAILGTGKSN